MGSLEDYFTSSSKLEAKKNKIKGIVFGNQKDISSTFKLIEILKYHNIKIHNLKKDVRLNEKKFSMRLLEKNPFGHYLIIKKMLIMMNVKFLV